MAFANEIIPEDIKKTFDFSEFKRYGHPIDISPPYKTWTIDHQRNAFLLCTDSGSGRWRFFQL